MESRTNIPSWLWKISLAACAAVWGGSFVVLKNTLDFIGPGWLLTIRFGATALLITLFVGLIHELELSCKVLKEGPVLGLLSGAGFLVQNVGLVNTTPGRNAFLTAVYCVLVPFINWILFKKQARLINYAAAFLCVCGVGLVSLGEDFSFELGIGDQTTLIAAVLYALHIVFVARFSQTSNVLSLTVVQLVVSALVCLVFAALFEQPPELSLFGKPEVIQAFLYLVLLSSCFAMVMQNVAQAYVEPAQASLILSLESVFAVITSALFYGEDFSLQVIMGFSLIFFAIVLSEIGPSIHAKMRNID